MAATTSWLKGKFHDEQCDMHLVVGFHSRYVLIRVAGDEDMAVLSKHVDDVGAPSYHLLLRRCQNFNPIPAII